MTLQQYLAKYKLSQVEFSKEVCCHPAAITRIVHRKTYPSYELCLAIHRATNGLVSLGDYPKLRA